MLKQYLLGLVVTATLCSAQTQPAAEKTSTTPNTLVRISVDASDNAGAPATDLTAADFKVFDRGKPVSVVSVRRNAPVAGSSQSVPNEYTNSKNDLGHSTVILFDLLNESQQDRLDVWRQLKRTLPSLEDGDAVYLYLLTLEGTLVPVRAIGDTALDARKWPQQVGDTLDKAMKSASHARPAGMDDETVVKKTYVALETLANQLSTLHGRRDIVWITDGMPNVWNPKTPCSGDWVECALYVPHLSVTLDHDVVSVDPLSYTPNPDSSRDLGLLANLTGGRTFTEQDVTTVVKQVQKSAAGSYTLAFDESPESADGKFHNLRVLCDRDGTRLQAQQRFYAIADTRPLLQRQQAVLIGAYQNVSDVADIALHATVAPSPQNPKSVHLQIQISTMDLALREDADQFSDALTVLVEDLGAKGPLGEPTLSNFNLKMTRQQKDALMKGSIPIALDHPLKDGEERLRVIVLDQAANAVGSVTLPVKASTQPS